MEFDVSILGILLSLITITFYGLETSKLNKIETFVDVTFDYSFFNVLVLMKQHINLIRWSYVFKTSLTTVKKK